MLKFKKINLGVVLLTSLVILSCSSSTSSRYNKNEIEDSIDSVYETSNSITAVEDFDITPYKTDLTLPENKKYAINEYEDIWYGYGNPQTSNKIKSLVGTSDGFRVLVLTTDNSEEANLLKSDEYFSATPYEIYIDFEPPFYKVKIGDFNSQKSAEDLRFKLNQLGYKEAKVIKDKVNVFE